jgi:chemotaxis protein histidine kinase CheA
MAALEADNLLPVSPDFMRAAHTLASTSRTTGFAGIADAAHALEKWLQAAIDLPPEFDASRLGGTRRAVDALGAMVQSVRGQALPHPREDVIELLDALREGLRQSRRTGEGTHLRMPGVVRDEPAQVAEAAPAPSSRFPSRSRKRRHRSSNPRRRSLKPSRRLPKSPRPSPKSNPSGRPLRPRRRNSRPARTSARSRTTSTASCCRSSSRKRARSSRW